MNAAELALMGLLLEGPNYPYRIEQLIEERNMREWTEIGFSSIYYLLNKLEQEGLVRVREDSEPGTGPARNIYSLTSAGRAAWRQANLAALSQPPEPRSPFLLAMSQAPAQPPAKVLAALAQRLEELEQRREHLKRRWQQAGQGQFHFLDALFELPLALLRAEQDWLQEFMLRLSEADPGDPAD
jgi:DNA-binding PadR family transcriptional regulator